ncbi:MAG: hypothetical protein SHS37scaffold145_44 [Phage 71_18]|nr:MAG: hypothetical protein SHS37scaffold145_44 [Phage 71_18]
MSATAVATALAAELRAVEEGHHARWDDARGLFLVKSDSGPRTYEVHVHAVVYGDGSAVLRFSCTCPGSTRGRDDKPMRCKHAALVARRLERMGLAEWDGTSTPWRPLGALLTAAQG